MEIDFKKYPLPKRVRHHTSPNLYISADNLIELQDYYPPLIESVDWKLHFENGKPPNIIDVGAAKGAFLLDMSEQHPDKNIFGIELREKLALWLAALIKSEDIPNCSAVWYSIMNGLKFIEDKSVEKVFYLFPDPWPKRKHNKRRAFNPDTLLEYNRILKPDGSLYLATDVPEINDYHKHILEQSGKFDFRPPDKNLKWDFPLTNKEKFCNKMNIPTYKLISNPK